MAQGNATKTIFKSLRGYLIYHANIPLEFDNVIVCDNTRTVFMLQGASHNDNM